MSYTRITRPYGGLVHIVANETSGHWGSACDGNRLFDRELIGKSGADVPTCLRCIVDDAEWWETMGQGLRNKRSML